VVSKKSNIHSTNDLVQSGLRFGINGTDSLSGYHCIRAWLHENQVSWNNFKFFETGSHYNSMAWITSDELDVAAVDVFCLLKLRKERPEMFSKIRVLDDTMLGPYPSQPIVIGVDNPMKEKLQEGFLKVGKEALTSSFISRFSLVDPDYYTNLENLLEQIKHVRPEVVPLKKIMSKL